MLCLSQPGIRHISKTLLLFLLCSAAAQIVADTVIRGVEDEAADNVKLMLSLQQEQCDAPKWKIQSLFLGADTEISQALRALGYYHAHTKKSLAFEKDCWKASFNISPGPRVSVSDIDIDIGGDARNDPVFLTGLKKMPLTQGSPLHHGHYESMKKRIESLALDNGYLLGSFSEKKLIVDKQHNTALIKLTFDSGKRMAFGEMTVQQDVLDAGFVAKYLTIKSGDIYTNEQLAKTHNALSQSGYFDTVDIRSGLEHIQDQRVPVTIKLTAKKRARYGFGVGFDTDIGPLLNASYINRRINRYGHFFTANFDLSPVLSTAEMEYIIPLDKPTTDQLSFGGGLKRENTDTFESLTATLSARHKHAYTNGWRQTLFIDYSYEAYTAASDSGRRLLLVPGGNWLRSVSNDPVRPTEGYRVEFETRGSVANPLSDTSFLQGYLSAIWLHQLPFGGVFLGRTLQGATLVDQITQLPTSYRFYAGGINSVRGYGYKELGPRDSSGDVAGGKFLSMLSAEYEHEVYPDWALAGFVDTGNAFNLDSIRFKTGVGIGVRWYSPVGPIRLDFALPLNESDSAFQIHFAAGGRL